MRACAPKRIDIAVGPVEDELAVVETFGFSFFGVGSAGTPLAGVRSLESPAVRHRSAGATVSCRIDPAVGTSAAKRRGAEREFEQIPCEVRLQGETLNNQIKEGPRAAQRILWRTPGSESASLPRSSRTEKLTTFLPRGNPAASLRTELVRPANLRADYGSQSRGPSMPGGKKKDEG